MTRQGRLRLVALCSAAAVLRLSLPAPAVVAGGGAALAVPICGEAGHVLLIRVPGHAPQRKPSGDGTAPCCAICHSAMRKRAGEPSCCGEEDDDDVA
ncbi:hypothetical protein [Novosphingobium sp. SG720]|uniref:hypothetical protein n=1 Tax=Novosphingobium sp. SG720 TaxID=2586998 RepID=UPI001446391E|nr:hypothetical protein [Novosphingobium sp. SG720]NKJ44608.1 hypothetical protein [Novosphingobium sp. SG720]